MGDVVNMQTGEKEEPLEIDGRFVHASMTYPGDVSRSFDPLVPKGPDYSNQQWWFLKAVYNSSEDKTKVYFSLTPPDAFLKQFQAGAGR